MGELKRLLPYLGKYKSKIIWGFIFVTLSNISSTIIPRIVGRTIDMFRSARFTNYDINISIAWILGLTALSGLFMYLTRKTIIVSSRLIEYDLRRDFLVSIERQSLNFYNKNSTGSLMAHVTNDISAAREFLGPAIMYGANTVTTFFFALYFMLTLNPTITFMSLIPLPFIAVTTYKIGQKVHVSFRNVQEQFAKLTTQAQETFSGVRVVRSYVREDYENKRFRELSEDYYKKNLRLARIQSFTMPLLMVLVGFSLIIVLGYGGLQVIQHKATLGDITQFFIYLNLLIWPIAAIGWITNIIQRAAASAGRLGKIFDTVPEFGDNADTNFAITEIQGAIKFENVYFRYEENLPYILNNVNINVPGGSSLGIVGGVGSGKSTFVNLVSRLYEVTKGNIYIDGINLKEIPLEILRTEIGIVPQDPFLFSLNIADNIRFGKPGASMEEVIRASKIAQLHDDILTFNLGYDTILGERGITLSGGQKQRLAIARALLKEPKILILDDALSAIDTQTEDLLLRELRIFMRDRTTLIISHRISTVKDADNIITIDNGKIIESGTHDELLKLYGKYSEMFKRQQLEKEIEQL